MSGLFGGGGTKTVYVTQPATTTTAVSPEQAAAQGANKGATDLEKLTAQKDLTREYNKSAKRIDIGAVGGDTTLSSGSLLSLGSKLG